VHYARDAFEGLALMDKVMAAKRGEAVLTDPAREAALAARKARRERQRSLVTASLPDLDDELPPAATAVRFSGGRDRGCAMTSSVLGQKETDPRGLRGSAGSRKVPGTKSKKRRPSSSLETTLVLLLRGLLRLLLCWH